MPTIIDPATKLAGAVATLLANDPNITGYNWQRWESDADVAQPRGYVNVNFASALVDAAAPDEFTVEVVFEGKPKKASASDAVAEAMGQIRRSDLASALMTLITDNSITLIGKAQQLALRHTITGDIRRRTLTFVIFGQWNVAYVPD
jgi:hypothetical protein